MPSHTEARPSVERIICALILGADHPITPSEIQKILEAVEAEAREAALAEAGEISDEELEAAQAETDRRKPDGTDASGPDTGSAAPHTPLPPPQADVAFTLEADPPRTLSVGAIKRVITDLQQRFQELGLGMELVDVGGGFRFQTAPESGKWVRKMLNKGKPTRLPRAAIETLAIIAYQQPVTRAEIESIRGVSAGHVIKSLMELQLVRIIGRSDLPGRPFLFGTTPTFLNHFGLGSLNDLEPIRVESSPASSSLRRQPR